MTHSIKRSARPAAALLIGLALACAVSPAHAASARPNIVLIMADDMGYSDIGCYGGEIQTPNLDRLAAGGLRLTQFYNTARCCPTRASLLTGLYPHQAGVGHMMNDRGYDGYRGDLNQQCRTIAEVLGSAGYSTYMAGKWHVTKHTAPDGPKHNWPRQRGFDRFYGTIHGAGSFYDPNSLTRDNTQISPYADAEYQPEQYYYTDAISDNAVKFLAEHKSDAKPFFLYVAYTAAHWPMHALPKDIEKYSGKYDAGYAPIRKARYERMQQMGLIDSQWKLSPQAENWDAVEHKEWEARCVEVYAAMVDNMDQGVGRIVAQLEAGGQLDNTLVLYLQDNGGCAEGLGRSPRSKHTERPKVAPFKPMADDALQFAMIPLQTRDGFPLIQGPGAMPGPADTYIAYGRGWANVSNTPFREYKHWVHEGGVATPLIAHWPQGMERRGELESEPGHLIDVMATCVDVAGAKYPDKVGEHAIKPLEGRSLAPLFRGEAIERDAIYWEHEGNRAVRVGDWKLVAKGAKGPWELYDLKSDRSELNNLADQQPKRVKELAGRWQAYAERANVLPVNPQPPKKGKPAKKPPTKAR
jgi:arylsulfatase